MALDNSRHVFRPDFGPHQYSVNQLGLNHCICVTVSAEELRMVLGATHSLYEFWAPRKVGCLGLTEALDPNGTPGKAKATAIVAGEIRKLIQFHFVQCSSTDRTVEFN